MAANYSSTYPTGSVTVGKKNVDVTARNYTVNYADAVPTISADYVGFINGAGGKAVFGAVMTAGAFAFILGVIATGPLARLIGKKRFYQSTMLATALATAAVYWVPTDNLAAVCVAHVLVNLLAAPTAPLIWAMYADTADYGEWKGGRRATGLVFSAASFTQKLGWALGGALVGWLLALFGYVPGAVQSAGTVHGITLMMSLVPAIPALLACLALHFYELDEPAVGRMGRDLAAARAAAGDGTVAAS